MMLHMQIRRGPIQAPHSAPESSANPPRARRFLGAPGGWRSENYLYLCCAYREEVLLWGSSRGRAL